MPVARTLGFTPLSLAVRNMSRLLIARRQIAVVLAAIFAAILAVTVERNRWFSVTRIYLLLWKPLGQSQLQILLNRYRYSWKQCGEPLELRKKLLENVAHLHHLSAARFHVQFLFILQVITVPTKQVCWWLRISKIIIYKCLRYVVVS